MQQKIRIQVLGFFTITVDDVRVENLVARSRRGVSLLVRLILQQGRPVSTQQLIGELWGSDRPGNHESALKTRVCRLRDLLESVAPGLEECVQAEHKAYRYQPLENVTVDVLEMFSLVQRLQGELPPEERLDCCRQVMALYQGEPYLPVGTVSDVMHASYLRGCYLKTAHAFAKLLRERGDEEELVAVCRQVMALYQGEPYWPVGTVSDVMHASYLRGCYLKTAHAFAKQLRERGDEEELVAVCRQTLCQDPLDESMRAELMRALIRKGRPDEARQEYNQALRLIRQLLDSEPGEELQACYAQLTR